MMRSTARGFSLLLAAMLAAGCGDPHGAPVQLEQDGLGLEVSLEPSAPRVGDNAMWLVVSDSTGRPIEDAEIEASVRMPAMGAMAAMGGPAAVEAMGEGRYRARFELAMGSTWQVELRVRAAEDRALLAEGSLTVGSPGLRLDAMPDADSGLVDGDDAGDHADDHTDDHAGDPRGDRAGAVDGRADAHPGEFVLPADRLQRVGVTLARAETKTLSARLRAVGRVVAPESDQVDVSLKLRGWAASVTADAVGVAVARGDVLFEVDSPELSAAQHEYVEALRSQERARATSAPNRADGLVAAAKNRLRRFGVDEREIERLTRTREVGASLPIRAPIAGYVVEKNIVRGGAFEAGDRLYRLAPLAPVWIEAEIYESELERVNVGQRARITLAHAPGRVFEAPITLLQPSLDSGSRTTRVRLEVANRDFALRPNQFVNVELELPGEASVVVPQSAVLQAGTKSFVFRALGGGRFRPQPVELGRRAGEEVEIRSGLAAGDEIVRSGTFLIAAESRLRAALEQW